MGLARLEALGRREAGWVAARAVELTVIASRRKLCSRFKTVEVAALGPKAGRECWYARATL